MAPVQPDQHTFSFALNPGLVVRHIAIAAIADGGGTASGRGSLAAAAPAWTSHLGWTRLTLSGTQFAPRRSVQVTITYGGRLAFSRDDYASASSLYFGPASQFGPDAIHDYVRQGIALLEGTGDWYPLPWTSEASGAFLFRQSFDQVPVRIPAAYVVRCSLATAARSADGRWQVVDVRPGGVLPMAFMAALAAPERMNLGRATVLYRGVGPTTQVEGIGQRFLEQTAAMDRWLGSASGSEVPRTLTAVIVPLIRHPVIGPGLLLLPETPDPAIVSAASYSDVAGTSSSQPSRSTNSSGNSVWSARRGSCGGSRRSMPKHPRACGIWSISRAPRGGVTSRRWWPRCSRQTRNIPLHEAAR